MGLHHLLADGVAPERIGTGFTFTEGPVWDPAGFLLFSDMPGDVRRRWSPDDGVTEVCRPSNKGNGMAYDASGRLLICEHATSRLVRQDANGSTSIVASHFEGRELNSPNDVVVSMDGSILFSDPTYGRTAAFGVEREPELDVRGVYRITVDGAIERIADDFDQPNGLCWSPDESILYVNDTERGHIRTFTRGADGRLTPGAMFAEGIASDDDPGVPDGMKVDSLGNVYVTGPYGVWVFDPAGQRLGVIEVPEPVGNLNWGGPGWSTLFVTASTSLYRLEMAVRGAPVPNMQRGS